MARKAVGTLFIVALILAAAIRFPLIPATPLQPDEAVYAETISELLRSPLQFFPHYLGSPTAWKPPAAFYAYAAVKAPLSAALPGLPIEYAFRVPPALFAGLSVIALFFLLREFLEERQALFASLIFAVSNQVLATTNAVLLDSALLFFMLLALFAYVKSLKSKCWCWLACAALFSVLAALTKTYAAFLIPVAAFALYYYFDKRRLNGRAFIASLFAVPAAMVLYAIAYAAFVPDGLREISASYLYDSVARMSGSLAHDLAQNAGTLFRHMFPWVLLSIAGAALLNIRKKEDKFLSFWAALSLIPLASGTGYYWYFLPAAPPLSALAARALSRLGWRNAVLATAAFAAFSLAAYPAVSASSHVPYDEREAGFALAGNPSVLSLTANGVPSVFFYKFARDPDPNYGGVRQMVANPYGSASYSAFSSIADVAFGSCEPNGLANPAPGYVSSLVSASNAGAVLMDRGIYLKYAEQPAQGYFLAFESSNGAFFIISRNQ